MELVADANVRFITRTGALAALQRFQLSAADQARIEQAVSTMRKTAS